MAGILRIQQMVIDAIIAHAKHDAPNEACGYLAEKKGVVTASFPLTNKDASQEHFALDTKEQFDVIRKMRADGLTARAVYHSHPASPARPSPEDIKLAYDPNLSYVIVSLANGSENVRSFRIAKGKVTEETIEIIVDKPF